MPFSTCACRCTSAARATCARRARVRATGRRVERRGGRDAHELVPRRMERHGVDALAPRVVVRELGGWRLAASPSARVSARPSSPPIAATAAVAHAPPSRDRLVQGEVVLVQVAIGVRGRLVGKRRFMAVAIISLILPFRALREQQRRSGSARRLRAASARSLRRGRSPRARPRTRLDRGERRRARIGPIRSRPAK